MPQDTGLAVLVTGGAGYIGSHACKAFAHAGYLPITYDNLSRGNRWAVKWGPIEEGDIADSSRVSAVLNTYKPVALMHFAAYAYVEESVQQPLLYYRNNFAATAALLDALLKFSAIPSFSRRAVPATVCRKALQSRKTTHNGRSTHMAIQS